MVTPDGHAKVLDFGLAKLLEPPGADGTGEDPADAETLAKTQAGLVMGTVAYMSPEQARAQNVDHRSDLFSLGVVLYYMATGQLPFSGNSPIDTMHAIAYEETRPVTQIRTNLPASLQRVLSRCMRKRPEDRYADARQFVDALKTVQGEIETGVSSKVPIVERLRDGFSSIREVSLNQWGMGVIGIAAAGALFYLMLSRWDLPLVILVAFGGLLTYRRIKNRPRRLLNRFVSKIRKMPEVDVIARSGQEVTVVVDKAVAKTYVRINAAMDKINEKKFFGDPFSVTVRDDLSDMELRSLLHGSVLHVRDDEDETESKKKKRKKKKDKGRE
jgi:serine/threonine protein kinase